MPDILRAFETLEDEARSKKNTHIFYSRTKNEELHLSIPYDAIKS